jgi:hypothetical protein
MKHFPYVFTAAFAVIVAYACLLAIDDGTARSLARYTLNGRVSGSGPGIVFLFLGWLALIQLFVSAGRPARTYMTAKLQEEEPVAVIIATFAGAGVALLCVGMEVYMVLERKNFLLRRYGGTEPPDASMTAITPVNTLTTDLYFNIYFIILAIALSVCFNGIRMWPAKR